MIRYTEPIIRPPAEAGSLLIQITDGCSHNRCAFCVTYKDKPYRVKPIERVLQEIDWAAESLPAVRKVFLCDGDPLCLGADHLRRILDHLYLRLPELRRVSVYGSAKNASRHDDGDLRALVEAGLSQVYVGLESGNDEVLVGVGKGIGAAESVRHCRRLADAGLKLSVMVILGLGGPRLSMAHAEDSALAINAIKPRFASALTLMLPFGQADYRRRLGDPSWRELTPAEALLELRRLVEGIDEDGIIFRSDHVSNYLALAGTFNKSKARMIAEIDLALGEGA